MEGFLYRYTSFETFVGMIQSQNLTFVLPELWEDPYELRGYYELLKKEENIYDRIIFSSIFHKTFCQSWTEVEESDAMWRIYSYNCRALRIAVKKESIYLLENVEVVPIKYNDFPTVSADKSKEDMFIDSLCQKRTAFKHEEEIRLISTFKFHDWDDVERHVKAFVAISDHPNASQILETLFPSSDMSEQVIKVTEMLNLGKNKKTTKDISFRHIPDFIDSVMVHPQAPDWYAKIVEDFCKINNVHYEGKSKLYKDIDCLN